MKVDVNMNIESKDLVNSSANRGYDLIVGPPDSVSSIKERLASMEATNGFDQVLEFGGKVLDEDRRLVDCGVKEEDSLDFVVRASVEAFVQQLRELLQARALSPSELGLMYCHRYGIQVAQALKTLGKEETFETLLSGQKHIALENGLVKVNSSSGTNPKKGALEKSSEQAVNETLNANICVRVQNWSHLEELNTLGLAVDTLDTVRHVKDRIGKVELLPCSDHRLELEGNELQDGQTLSSCGLKEGMTLTATITVSEDEFVRQLAALLQARALTLHDLSLRYCYRHGVPTAQVVKAFGWGQRFPDFVKQRKEFIVASGCVRLA